MSNLTPEKRVNKNGVAVTKHVRASAKTALSKALPVPALTGSERSKAAKGKHLTKKQLEPEYRTLIRKHFNTDNELLKLLNAAHQSRRNEIFVFTRSDAEVYDVIAVAGFTNAGVLLDSGFRTGKDAESFLRMNKLDRLVTDESEVVREALDRGIPSQYVFDMYRKHFTDAGENLDTKLLLDSAEAMSHKGLRDARFTPSIPDRIASGSINMDDLRTVGSTRFLKALEPNGFLLNQLMEMNSGNLKYTAEQMKETILKFTDDKNRVGNHQVRGTLAVARVYGYEFASSLKHPTISPVMMLATDGDDKEKLRAIEYAETLVDGVTSKWGLTAQTVAEMFRNDVDPVRAAGYINDNTPMEQVLAIEKEGIAPSVSGGWL